MKWYTTPDYRSLETYVHTVVTFSEDGTACLFFCMQVVFHSKDYYKMMDNTESGESQTV